jgi:pyruvate,water dikinase
MALADSRAFVAAGGFAGYPEIEKSFAKFLRDHGHREVEFDPYHPTWVEAPHLVVDNLKVMLDAQHESPHDKERDLKIEMREAEVALVSRMPAELQFAAHEIIRLARAYTTLDDVEHYQTTRLTLPFRRGLKALGRKLLDMGVIAEAMDVFFAANKEAYLRNRTRTPDWILGETEEEVPPGSVETLVGLPGSPGVATGPVFKVYSADDFAAFPKGAVLVARTTNPAWTPLFYRASAVITESGGPLSHGAVTAREIGLPAVMSVKGALRLLENGQVVSVEGSKGQVNTN